MSTRGEPDYIFVAGCGHSGTTLLAAILGAHSRVFTIATETNCFVPTNRTPRTDDEKRAWLEAHAKECDKPDVTYICEKTPSHIRRFDDAHRLYPEAKLICIVRDPRDVAASYKRRGLTVERCITFWRKAAKSVAKWQRKDIPVLVVSFEGLLRQPPETLVQVCEFLRLPYEPGMLDYWKADRMWQGTQQVKMPVDESDKKGHRDLRNWQMHQPLMPSRIGTYANSLQPDELENIVSSLSHLAIPYGYELGSRAEEASKRLRKRGGRRREERGAELA